LPGTPWCTIYEILWSIKIEATRPVTDKVLDGVREVIIDTNFYIVISDQPVQIVC